MNETTYLQQYETLEDAAKRLKTLEKQDEETPEYLILKGELGDSLSSLGMPLSELADAGELLENGEYGELCEVISSYVEK